MLSGFSGKAFESLTACSNFDFRLAMVSLSWGCVLWVKMDREQGMLPIHRTCRQQHWPTEETSDV